MPDTNLPYVIGGGVVAATAVIVLVRKLWNRSSDLVDAAEDVVILRQVPREEYAPSMSPFPLKLETYLRMAKIPYKNINGLKMSPKTGKTPWAQLNGEILTDSQLIIQLISEYFKVNTMEHVSPRDQAVGRAFQKMLEENTYWCMVKWRWVLDKDKFMYKVSIFPTPVLWIIKRQLEKYLYGQGIGRLPGETVLDIARGDLSALSAYMGDRKFLLGEKPCEVDCAIFGMLAQFKWNSPPESALWKIINEFPNLLAYCDRMKEAFWPEWDELKTHGYTQQPTKGSG